MQWRCAPVIPVDMNMQKPQLISWMCMEECLGWILCHIPQRWVGSSPKLDNRYLSFVVLVCQTGCKGHGMVKSVSRRTLRGLSMAKLWNWGLKAAWIANLSPRLHETLRGWSWHIYPAEGGGEHIHFTFWKLIIPMTDPWCWYANMTGVNLDGIHVTIYIYSIHGSVMGYKHDWGILMGSMAHH